MRPAVAELGVAHRGRLEQAAREAGTRSYAPYSRFRVGAAVLTQRGTIIPGCKVENASYGLTSCAERNAVCAAVAAEGKEMRIVAIAILTAHGGAGTPCGACRQVIAEFGPHAIVIFRGAEGVEQMRISDLLPGAFASETMEPR